MLATVSKGQSEGDWHSIPGFITTRLGLGNVGHVAAFLLAAVFAATLVWLLRKVWRGEIDWIDGAGWATVALLVTASAAAALVRRLADSARRAGQRSPAVARRRS